MGNSDIIKIGFDYRSSLAQFEKDTNGVFDGISNKAGKQRITIQLDAKDDKVIDKIKELQKLKLDKFTFEFGDSGLKEQLQTFDKLENKINEIINLGKGKSFIDSSPTVTDIGKIENKINELNKKYEEAQKKLSSIGSGDISGKDVNLVDNAEFQKLTQEVSKLKNQFDDLKTHMQLLDDCTVPTDRFFELQSQVEGATARVSDLVDEFTKLSNAQKVLSSTPQESNISSELDEQKKIYDGIIKNENDTFELTSDIGLSHEKLVQKISEENKQIEAGNAAFKERISLLDKQGNVIKTFVGEKDNVKSFVDKNNGAEKLLHTHPSSEEYGGNFSTADIYNFINEAIYNGVKQVELVWRDKITTLDFSGMSNKALEKFADQYAVLKKTLITHFNEIGEDGNFRNLNDLAKNAQYVDTIAQKLLSDLGGKLSSNNLIDINDKELENILSLFKEIQGIYSQISENTTLDEISKLEEKLLSIQKTYKENQVQTNDAFPNADTKLDEAVTSAKDLDKTLEQVDIPTDSFDKVLEKLDRTKSELVDIVKITKQSVSDADRKFHDSYTLKDSRGSTEIYGVNSKTDKGQILRQNIVGYDKKKDELDISKAQLEVDKQLAKEEDNLAKVQQKKAQAFLKEQANYEEDQKKAELIKRQTLAYEELTDTISKYSEVAKRVAGGNADDGDLELMTKLEDKISQLQKQPILSDSQVSKSEKSLVSLYDQLDKIERKLVETNQKSQDKQIVGFDKRLESYTKKTSGYDATIARFNDGGWTSDTYLKNVQAVRDAVKQYATLLDNIKTNQNGIASDEDIQNLDKYEKKIKDTIATVTNMSASEKGYSQLAGQKEIDKINKILRENSAMSSEAKAKIKAYKQELISGNPSVSLEKIHGEIMKIVNAEELAGRAGRSMFDVIKEKAFYGFAAQIGMYFGFNDIVNGFKQVASTVIDLNTQITDLAKVSEATSSQIYDDFSSYADIAKDVGGTISDTISATADWSRNGYNLPDSKELARVALLYKNVGDGIDIDTANESLISTLRGFKMEADEAEKIIDIFNNVSNNEPIDSGGIGEALQRSAASFNAANTSLQESVALISTTNSVIQNPEKVGNMWKVVSMRIRSATSELEQAGEDTDGLVTSTADLQKMIKAMTGYDILESDGKTFKSIYDIVLNISKVWNNLSDLDQSSLLQALAGVTTKMFARIYRNINHRIYLIARVA